MQTTVRVEGLKETVAALNRLDGDVRKSVRGELREIGGLVADEARAIAGGFRQSGDTARGVKVSVRGTVVAVRSTASHRGFVYPKRLEYEQGSSARPHLFPALDRKRATVVDRVEQVVDRALDTFER